MGPPRPPLAGRRSSAANTGRAARTTAEQAARATARRAEAETTRLGAVAHQAERAVLIPVGAALEARDRVTGTVRTYSDSRLTRQQLNRFERRGAKAPVAAPHIRASGLARQGSVEGSAPWMVLSVRGPGKPRVPLSHRGVFGTTDWEEGTTHADFGTDRDRDRHRSTCPTRAARPSADRDIDDRALGIAGALVGGIVASAIGEGDIFELNFIGTIVGIAAAALLIAVAEGLGTGDAQRV